MSSQRRPIRRNDNASASKQYYEDKDLGSVWLEEFLAYEKTRKDSIVKADLYNFTKLPGSTVHPHAEKHLQSKSIKSKTTDKSKASCMTTDERRRLNELSRQLYKKDGPALTTNPHKRQSQKKLMPYVEANTKISRVLKHVKLKTNREDMKASQLNNFYRIVAHETKSAIQIQSQCRRVLASKYTKRFRLEVHKATQIQSRVRMFLSKRLLEQLKEIKRLATEVRERFLRLYIARYQRKKPIKLENESATLCQSVVKMYFAKCLLNQKKLQYSWEVNQFRWRSLSTRLAWKDLRLNFYARQIQCMIRRALAKFKVLRMFVMHTKSAVAVQCVWRRFAAKIRKDDIVYRAAVDVMCNKIRLIASEKKYWKEQVDELNKPSKLQHLRDLEDRKHRLQTDLAEKDDQIRTLESHYNDQLQLQEQISPRAIASGWEEQLKINLNDTRERITEAKLESLFRIQIELKKTERELQCLYAAYYDAKQSFGHWSHWHQVEQDQMWEFQRKHNQEVESRELRHAIVNEKLKWAVTPFVHSGKPDKRRPLANGPVENELVEHLIDEVKNKSDQLEAFCHAENTFKPFQRFWDSLSKYASQQSSLSGIDLNVSPSRQKSAPPEKKTLDSAKTDLNSRAFPTALPFGLVEKVREERKEIAATLKPK